MVLSVLAKSDDFPEGGRIDDIGIGIGDLPFIEGVFVKVSRATREDRSGACSTVSFRCCTCRGSGNRGWTGY